MVSDLAIPVLVGGKTAQERFAGALNTLCCEAMTRDGKALQMGRSTGSRPGVGGVCD